MHPEILGYTNSKVHIVPTFRVLATGSKVAHARKEVYGVYVQNCTQTSLFGYYILY